MVVSQFVAEENRKKADKALLLYQQGHSFREIAREVSMSYEWVRGKIRELEKLREEIIREKNKI